MYEHEPGQFHPIQGWLILEPEDGNASALRGEQGLTACTTRLELQAQPTSRPSTRADPAPPAQVGAIDGDGGGPQPLPDDGRVQRNQSVHIVRRDGGSDGGGMASELCHQPDPAQDFERRIKEVWPVASLSCANARGLVHCM